MVPTPSRSRQSPPSICNPRKDVTIFAGYAVLCMGALESPATSDSSTPRLSSLLSSQRIACLLSHVRISARLNHQNAALRKHAVYAACTRRKCVRPAV
jgi:hypothetical protein